MYNHFDGQGRAPPGVNTDEKTGKCPLYDESHKRKDQQVDKAEKEAMVKVREEHPDLSEEDLKINFAKGVQSSSNQHHGDHHHHIHPLHREVHGNHNHHHRHRGHGIGDAAMAALYNREQGGALNAIFGDVRNMLDEFGEMAPHAMQQARDQGRQAREQMRVAQQTQQLQLQQQLQYQREALLRQQQQAARQAQNHAALLRQEALREDLRRLQQTRGPTGLNQATHPHRAHLATMGDPLFAQFLNGPQAVNILRPRQNEQAFGNIMGPPNPGTPNDVRARRQSNGIRHRTVEERLQGLGGQIDFDLPTQTRETNDYRRRTAELNAERTAEGIAEERPYDGDPFDLDAPLRMPGEYPRAPRRRNPMLR